MKIVWPTLWPGASIACTPGMISSPSLMNCIRSRFGLRFLVGGYCAPMNDKGQSAAAPGPPHLCSGSANSPDHCFKLARQSLSCSAAIDRPADLGAIVPFSPIAAHRLHFATRSLAAERLTDKHQQQQGSKHGVHECSFGAPAGRVQRKNNRSGVLIEQYGGFAISTRNAEGG